MLHRAHNRFDAQELWQQDHDHFLHPFTHFDSFRKDGSLVLVEGEGCYVTDAHGKRYFDGIGGMWCVNAGYGRKEIAEAMAEQALQLCYTTTFVDVTNAPAAAGAVLPSGKVVTRACEAAGAPEAPAATPGGMVAVAVAMACVSSQERVKPAYSEFPHRP